LENFFKFLKIFSKKNFFLFPQTSALLKRSILDNIRNPGLAKAKLSQKLIMGIFIGLLYFQTLSTNFIGISNLNGAMFYIVVELTYSTLFGIITFMPADFNLIVREYHDGLYNLLAYFVARIWSYIPLFAIDGIVLVGSSYWMTGLVPNVGRFGIALGMKKKIFFWRGGGVNVFREGERGGVCLK